MIQSDRVVVIDITRPRDLPPGTLVRQCQACVTAARSR